MSRILKRRMISTFLFRVVSIVSLNKCFKLLDSQEDYCVMCISLNNHLTLVYPLSKLNNMIALGNTQHDSGATICHVELNTPSISDEVKFEIEQKVNRFVMFFPFFFISS